MIWDDENTRDYPTSWDMDGQGSPFRWDEDVMAMATVPSWALDLVVPWTNDDGELIHIDVDMHMDEMLEVIAGNGMSEVSWLYTGGNLPPPEKSDWNTVYKVISTPGFTEEDLISTGWSLDEAYEMDRAIDANRYFVGQGTSAITKSWNRANNWSTSSGGAPGAGVPTNADDVFFDANSNDCDIDLITADCDSITTAGYADTLDINGNNLIVATGVFSHTAGTIINSGFVQVNNNFTMTGTWTDASGHIDIDATCTWNATLTTSTLEWDAINGTITVTTGNTITVTDNFTVQGSGTNDVTVTAAGNFTIDLDAGISSKFGNYAAIDHMQLGAGDTLTVLNGTDNGNNDADITFSTADRASNATGDFDDDSKWDGGTAPTTGVSFEVLATHIISVKGAEAAGNGFIDGTLRFDGQADSAVSNLTLDNTCALAVTADGTIDTTGTGSTGYALLDAASGECHMHNDGTITIGAEFHFDSVHSTPLTVGASENFVADGNLVWHDGFTVAATGNFDDGGNQIDIEAGAVSIASGGYTATGSIRFLGDHNVSGAGLSFNDVTHGTSPGRTTYTNDVIIAGDSTIGSGDEVCLDCASNTVTMTFSKTASQPTFTITDNDSFFATNNTVNAAGIEGNGTQDVAITTGTIDWDLTASGLWVVGDADIQTDQTTGGNTCTITQTGDVIMDAITVSATDTWDADSSNLTAVKAGAANCMIVNGTVTFGSGTHSIGATTTYWGISVGNGATVDEETATMTYGPVNIGNGATHTTTTGTTTVVSSYVTRGDCWNVDAGATMDYTGNELIFAVPNACSITDANATNPQDLTVNHASCVLTAKTQALGVANNLTITLGAYNTNSLALTVGALTDVTGTITTKASTFTAKGNVTVNGAGTITMDGNTDSTPAILILANGVTLQNDGTVDQTGTGSTGYASIAGVSAEPITNGDISWGNGYWKLDEVDIQVDVTTGGSGCTVEFIGDCTIDGFTCSSGDTVKCTTQNTTITGVTTKAFQVLGSGQFNGASGNNVVLTSIRFLKFFNGSTMDMQYVSVTNGASGDSAVVIGSASGGTVTNTQFDNCTLTSATIGALKAFAGTSNIIVTNCTLSGKGGANWYDQDIVLMTGCNLTLDTCTFTTVGMQATSGWLLDKDGSSNFTIYGILASSETPSAGYRANDITDDLTLSQADAYSSSFNTSYTLGANMINTDAITIDASTTLTSGNTETITASGNVAIAGTLGHAAWTGTLTIGGNMSGAGPYLHGANDTEFDGATCIIRASFTFYNLTDNTSVETIIDDSASHTIENTLTINNVLSMQGGAGDSTLTLGTASASGTFTNSGTFRPGRGAGANNCIVQAANSGYMATLSGGGTWDWDYNGGAFTGEIHWKWLDHQYDITTGGGGCTIEFTGDCTIDAITVTANDTLKCVTANTTITGNSTKAITLNGTCTLNGSVGNNVVFDDMQVIRIENNSTIDFQYLTLTGAGTNLYFIFSSGVTLTQLDNITSTSSAGGALGLNNNNIDVIITNSTFSGAGALYYQQDVFINAPGKSLILDTCIFSTVGLLATSGWILAKDGSSNFTIYGILASSETPPAGYRAADITGDLTLSQADAYSSSFNTSYTLGANAVNIDNITIDASTTLDTSGTDYGLTVNGYTLLDGTLTCNASTCQFGSNTFESNWGLYLSGGTFNGGSGTHNISSFYMDSDAGSNATLTSGVTTLTSKRSGGLNQIFRKDAGTFGDGDGTVTITETTAVTFYENSNSPITLYNLIINGGATVQFFNGKGFALTIANNLTITSGTFDTSEDVSGTSRDLTVTNLTSITDTLTLNGSTVALAAVTVNDAGTVALDTSTTALSGALVVGGGASGAISVDTGSLEVDGATTINTGATLGTAAKAYTLDLDGNLNTSAGTLIAPNASGTFTFAGSTWNAPSTFTHSSGLVTFDGSAQTLNNGSSFYSFTKTVAAAETLTFKASVTQTFSGIVTMQGASGQLLALASDSAGTRWNISLQATATKAFDYVSVIDGNASPSDNSLIPVYPSHGLDLGNNINWFSSSLDDEYVRDRSFIRDDDEFDNADDQIYQRD